MRKGWKFTSARRVRRRADVSYYDPHVPVIRPTREHSQWSGTKSIPWERASVAGFDAVIIVTAHACVNYQELGDWAQCIVDTRNVMASVQLPPGRAVWKA
jgi:UDP-N-acetyl-D-glucosamine dehydrogenase